MTTIEQREVELADQIGRRWSGPTVTTASKKLGKEGRIRRAYYDNAILEETICRSPDGGDLHPETWPINTQLPFRSRPG